MSGYRAAGVRGRVLAVLRYSPGELYPRVADQVGSHQTVNPPHQPISPAPQATATNGIGPGRKVWPPVEDTMTKCQKGAGARTLLPPTSTRRRSGLCLPTPSGARVAPVHLGAARDSAAARRSVGAEVEPDWIRRVLGDARRGFEEEFFFRWAAAPSSTPVSLGYGPPFWFLVSDAPNETLIGLIGVGDPVLSLAPRDRWGGWDMTRGTAAMKYVLDTFVLGAIPPYSMLRGGKLVALERHWWVEGRAQNQFRSWNAIPGATVEIGSRCVPALVA